jgi:predicted TIM-barrel fold metal-dependent hydrolase
MDRRTFLSLAASLVALDAGAQTGSIPIIDTHIHLFDPRRPEGIPWPEKTDTLLYRPALPDRYRALTKGLGIVGAIEVECSARLEDNQWVLDTMAKDAIMVGTVGDLEPGKPDFRKNLDRFHRNPMFLGIRCGNLWGRDLTADITRPDFISDLKALAAANLEMDSANPDPTLISTLVRLTDKVPNLRVVIDHLPHLDPPADPVVRKKLDADLRELGARPQVFVKISEILHPVSGKVHYDVDFYRSRLDELWGIFGENQVLYGSDWPNSDPFGTYQQVISVAREYVSGKTRVTQEKYFWKNSIRAYHWVKRDAKQRELTA